MGFIGKLLVVLHGALSLAVLGWATGVVTHRIDWNTPPAEEGKEAVPGLYERQKTKVEEYNSAVDKSFTRWTGNASQVVILEGERYPRRAFYAGQLESIQRGTLNGTAQADPVRLQVTDPATGYLDVRPTVSRPVFFVRDEKKSGDGTGVKSLSIAEYLKLMDQRVLDIAASQKKNADSLVEREKLNKEINGIMVPMLIKGLRQQIAEQLSIKDRGDAEDRYVVGFVTNREAEFDLVRKRRDAMTARIDELKKAGYPEKRDQ
jgi:hypothetical protein